MTTPVPTTDRQRKQCSNCVLMVAPHYMEFNQQTALDNDYQQQPSLTVARLRQQAMAEFDIMVSQLRQLAVEVIVIEPLECAPDAPDAVFPNNWFSTTNTGELNIFPMLTENRQREVNIELLQAKFADNAKLVTQVNDFRQLTPEYVALEGTGALIFDHGKRRIYAGLSNRCDLALLQAFAKQQQYQVSYFNSQTRHGTPVYHTNVMMSIAEQFAVVCEDVICAESRKSVMDELAKSKEVISISEAQMEQFCGNILQLEAQDGTKLIAMSATAYQAFSEQQKRQLAKYGTSVPFDIPTIEAVGGGSVRCMLAEVFLPNKSQP